MVKGKCRWHSQRRRIQENEGKVMTKVGEQTGLLTEVLTEVKTKSSEPANDNRGTLQCQSHFGDDTPV